MSSDAYADPRLIAELGTEVGLLGTKSRAMLTTVQSEVGRCRQRVDRAIETAEREHRRCVAALRSADSDDRGEAEAELQRARMHLREVTRVGTAAKESLDQLARCSQRVQGRLPDLVSRASQFLRSAEAALREYQAVALPGVDLMRNIAQGSAVSGSASVGSNPPTLEELQSASLPEGWAWMPLSEISRSADLGSGEGFPKVTRAEMVEGYRRLRSDVLPHLGARWSEVSDKLRAIDSSRGIHDTSGLHGAFEAFFSQDSFVRLEREKLVDGYGVTNGRHRIAVARELGWPAVPVRFDDGRS